MTLSEEECVQKWNSISETLSKLDTLIKRLSESHQKSAEMDNIEIAKLHQTAAYAMTELEKFKLRFNLSSEELKDHPIQIEEDRVEKYKKKILKAEKPVENRPFRIDANASKRTINHYTDK